MEKKKIDGLIKNVSQVRSALERALKHSKSTAAKSATVMAQGLNKEVIHSGIEATTQGIETAVEGLKFASKSALKLAASLEKSSEKIKKMGLKFNRKS